MKEKYRCRIAWKVRTLFHSMHILFKFHLITLPVPWTIEEDSLHSEDEKQFKIEKHIVLRVCLLTKSQAMRIKHAVCNAIFCSIPSKCKHCFNNLSICIEYETSQQVYVVFTFSSSFQSFIYNPMMVL